MSLPAITLVYPPEALAPLRLRVPDEFLPAPSEQRVLTTEDDFVLTTEDGRPLTTEG